jgi:hypothetical protein
MLIDINLLREYNHELYTLNLREPTFRYDPKLNLSFVNIPKCMSKNLVAVFEKSNLFREEIRYSEKLDLKKYSKFLVFLRDPVDRWYSGVVQYLTNNGLLEYLNDPAFCKLLFDAVQFDEHTSSQIQHLIGIETTSSYFFDCTKDVFYVLNSFMYKTFNVNLEYFSPKDPASDHKIKLIQFAKSYVDSEGISGPDLIKRYFRSDYRLMQNINWTFTNNDYKSITLI